MLRSAQDDGALAAQAGRWSSTGRLPVPRSLRQILATRLDALPADARDAAEFLAGLGRVPVGRFTSDRAVGLQTLPTNGLVTIEDRGEMKRMTIVDPQSGETTHVSVISFAD